MSATTKTAPREAARTRPVGDYINELVDTANVDPVEIFMAAKGAGVHLGVTRRIPGNDIMQVSMMPGATGVAGLEEVVRRIEALKQPDPLADLVEAYIAGNEAYNLTLCPDDLGREAAREFEEQRVAQTYGPHWRRLQNDPPAATTLRGVEALLRLMGDEEEFDCLTAASAAAAAAYFDRQPAPTAFAEPDPIFALIEAHKALWIAQEAAFVPGVIDPPQALFDAVYEASDAMQAIADCQPTTLAGCRAAAVYISEHPCNKGHGDTDQIRDAFDTLAAALKALVP